ARLGRDDVWPAGTVKQAGDQVQQPGQLDHLPVGTPDERRRLGRAAVLELAEQLGPAGKPRGPGQVGGGSCHPSRSSLAAKMGTSYEDGKRAAQPGLDGPLARLGYSSTLMLLRKLLPLAMLRMPLPLYDWLV